MGSYHLRLADAKAISEYDNGTYITNDTGLYHLTLDVLRDSFVTKSPRYWCQAKRLLILKIYTAALS